MLLIICNIFTIFCQSFLFVWTSNNITSKENKLSNLKFCALTLIIFGVVQKQLITPVLFKKIHMK